MYINIINNTIFFLTFFQINIIEFNEDEDDEALDEEYICVRKFFEKCLCPKSTPNIRNSKKHVLDFTKILASFHRNFEEQSSISQEF